MKKSSPKKPLHSHKKWEDSVSLWLTLDDSSSVIFIANPGALVYASFSCSLKKKKERENYPPPKSIRVSLFGSGLCFTRLQCSQALYPRCNPPHLALLISSLPVGIGGKKFKEISTDE